MVLLLELTVCGSSSLPQEQCNRSTGTAAGGEARLPAIPNGKTVDLRSELLLWSEHAQTSAVGRRTVLKRRLLHGPRNTF